MSFILHLGLRTAYCKFFCGKCIMGDESFSCTAGQVHSSMCEKCSCKQVLVSVTIVQERGTYWIYPPLHNRSRRLSNCLTVPAGKTWYRTWHKISYAYGYFGSFWRNSPQWARVSSFTRFLDHTQRHTTIGRTTVDEWSARRRDLYLTKHNAHNRQAFMPPWDWNPESQQTSGRRPTP